MFIGRQDSHGEKTKTRDNTRENIGKRARKRENKIIPFTEEMTYQWTELETQCLIALWGDVAVQGKLTSSYRNKTIYEEISRGMKENGFTRSYLQCQRKIKSLKTIYKEIKDANNKSGADRTTCPFYDTLDFILCDKPSVHPLLLLDSAIDDAVNTGE